MSETLGKLFSKSKTTIKSKVEKDGTIGLYYKGVLFSTLSSPEKKPIEDLFPGVTNG